MGFYNTSGVGLDSLKEILLEKIKSCMFITANVDYVQNVWSIKPEEMIIIQDDMSISIWGDITVTNFDIFNEILNDHSISVKGDIRDNSIDENIYFKYEGIKNLRFRKIISNFNRFGQSWGESRYEDYIRRDVSPNDLLWGRAMGKSNQINKLWK